MNISWMQHYKSEIYIDLYKAKHDVSDFEESEKWCIFEVDASDISSMMLLGLLYEAGYADSIVTKETAVEAYKKAVDYGGIKAQEWIDRLQKSDN